MNPGASQSDHTTRDETLFFAATSPWTDALHQAWTPSEEAEVPKDDANRYDDPPFDALTDTYNG